MSIAFKSAQGDLLGWETALRETFTRLGAWRGGGFFLRVVRRGHSLVGAGQRSTTSSAAKSLVLTIDTLTDETLPLFVVGDARRFWRVDRRARGAAHRTACCKRRRRCRLISDSPSSG